MRTGAFVHGSTRLSFNRNQGQRGQRYQARIAELYRQAGGIGFNACRCGVVSHCINGYMPATDPDVGNSSRRIWDALQCVVCEDDHVVRWQIAGLIEIGRRRGNFRARTHK
jgi:hypothetical protein